MQTQHEHAKSQHSTLLSNTNSLFGNSRINLIINQFITFIDQIIYLIK